MQSDQVSRFIKKVEKTEDFMDSVLISSTLSEEKVKQNVALEIYEDYFNTEDPVTNSEEFNVKTIISYPDPSKKIENQNRPVSFQTYTNIIKSFEFCFHIFNFLFQISCVRKVPSLSTYLLMSICLPLDKTSKKEI